MALEEPVTGRIVHPWIVIRATYAGLKVDGLSRNLFRSEFAGVGNPTSGRPVHDTLLLPRLETLRFCYRARILDPLDHLGHRHEVNVVVVGQDLVDPIKERVQEFGIVLQPGCVEIEAQGSAVLFVMSVKVVV